MDPLTVSVEDPAAEDVRALLQRHFDLMRSQSPAESCHVMEPAALAGAEVTLLGLREHGTLLGIGALARIGAQDGELKSMHTAREARGKGGARRILNALMALAAEQGLSRVSLETGTADDFAAARALYLSEGFERCPPFGDYKVDPLSTYMRRVIPKGAA